MKLLLVIDSSIRFTLSKLDVIKVYVDLKLAGYHAGIIDHGETLTLNGKSFIDGAESLRSDQKFINIIKNHLDKFNHAISISEVEEFIPD